MHCRFQIRLLHLLLLWLSLASSIWGQTSVNSPGQDGPVSSGTPVQVTNPIGIPTLTYNCAKMPSICNNVNAHYPLNPVPGGFWGTVKSDLGYYVFNLDKERVRGHGSRAERRRLESCPPEWEIFHSCPERNQPPVVPNPFNRGRTVTAGLAGQRLDPNALHGGGNAGFVQIANREGVDAGMAWTCNVFPPATFVEGGRNASTGQTTNTYCAPQRSDRGSNLTLFSEQDFQSLAHRSLETHVSPNPKDQGIYTIHFNTDFDETDGSFAAAVTYYKTGIFSSSKMSSHPHYVINQSGSDKKVLATRKLFENGSAVEYTHEVPLDHGFGTLEKRGYPLLGVRFLQREELDLEDNGDDDAVNEINTSSSSPDDVSSVVGKTVTSATDAFSAANTNEDIAPTSIKRSTGPSHATELRILPLGDSITVGYRSNRNGGDGNGYRGQLFKDLSHDYNVTFAGTEKQGAMKNGYFAAWNGRTIQVVEDRVPPSLRQNPNLILIHAGTNDMNSIPTISQQGNNPNDASQRLGSLIDECLSACPNATILVAQIIPTCLDAQERRTKQFNSLIPGIANQRAMSGHHVMIVNMQEFPVSLLHHDDCIHPTNKGYKTLGSMWAQAVRKIPADWVKPPVGPDPWPAPSNSANSKVTKTFPQLWMVSAFPTLLVMVWMATFNFILLLGGLATFSDVEIRGR